MKPDAQSPAYRIRAENETPIPQHTPTSRKSQPPVNPIPQMISHAKPTPGLVKPPQNSSYGKEVSFCVNPSSTCPIAFNSSNSK